MSEKQQKWMLAEDLVKRPGEHPSQVQAAMEHLGMDDEFKEHWAGGSVVMDRVNDTIIVYEQGQKLRAGWDACNAASEAMAKQFDKSMDRLSKALESEEEFAKAYTPQDPAHYRQGGIEPIVYIESHDMDFRAANVVKYITRYKHKGAPLDDLKKARWYLNRLIAEEEKK